MIVFKGFNKSMTCTMGRGAFKYKVGQKATAEKAKTANTGLHSTREPFGILRYYGHHGEDVYCICEAGGDINEDADGRVSSTELTPIKKLTPQELAIYEGLFIQKHPDISRENFKEKEVDNGFFAIARGKNPTAKGKKGTVLVLLQENASNRKIKKMEIFEIDGQSCKAGWYGIGGRIDDKREIEEAPGVKGNTGNHRQGVKGLSGI